MKKHRSLSLNYQLQTPINARIKIRYRLIKIDIDRDIREYSNKELQTYKIKRLNKKNSQDEKFISPMPMINRA